MSLQSALDANAEILDQVRSEFKLYDSPAETQKALLQSEHVKQANGSHAATTRAIEFLTRKKVSAWESRMYSDFS